MLKGETDEDGGKGGRALAVQDINAPAEYVWDRILDFDNYNKMASSLSLFFLSFVIYFVLSVCLSGCLSVGLSVLFERNAGGLGVARVAFIGLG